MSQSVKILQNLVHNEQYTRKVLPFLREEYFEDDSDKILFRVTKDFVEKYNAIPTIESLVLTINDEKNIPEKTFKDVGEKLTNIKTNPNDNIEWLTDYTEKFCKKRAQYLALTKAIAIYDGTDKRNSEDAIPAMLQEALAISFNPKVGHDFFENFSDRFEYYTRKEIKVPFDIDILNTITKGGVSKKTLTILIAGTNVGKTASMCHMSSANLMDGKNVLYITAEMSEEEISRRIDSNLLNVNSDELENLPFEMFENSIGKLKKRTQGRLIVKEYATVSAHVGHIKQLVNELNLKKNFIPDIIYMDYMNIFLSLRSKAVASDKSYGVVKSIAEEFRGLAVELNLPIITATQFNRTGHGDSDPDETDVADSFGSIMTADLVLGLIRNENLAQAGQLAWKQLKSRYMDKHKIPTFLTGFNPEKGRLSNIPKQTNIKVVTDNTKDIPVFDKSENGVELKRIQKKKLEWNG